MAYIRRPNRTCFVPFHVQCHSEEHSPHKELPQLKPKLKLKLELKPNHALSHAAVNAPSSFAQLPLKHTANRAALSTKSPFAH